MADDTPTIENTPARHRYELTLGGEVAAMIQYHEKGGEIELEHTEVDPRYEGRGLAGKIAQFAFDDVKARQLKAVVTCTYLQRWLQKHPDYAGLVKGS